MKNLNLLALIVLLVSGLSLQAQYDDLYYTETIDDAVVTVDSEAGDYDDSAYSEEYDDDDYESYNDDYEYYSEYDNYYASRIRRFNRPAGSNYYNGYYTNNLVLAPLSGLYGRRAFFTDNYRSYFGYYGSGFYGVPYGYFRGIQVSSYYGGYGFGGFGSGSYGSGFGRAGNIGGGYGCPVAGARGPIANTQRVTTNNSTVRTGARKQSATRASTGYRSGSRGQAYKKKDTSKAPRTSSTVRKSTTRTTTRPSTKSPRTTSSRSLKSNRNTTRSTSRTSSNNWRKAASSSFRSSSPSRSTSRSSSGGARRGKR